MSRIIFFISALVYNIFALSPTTTEILFHSIEFDGNKMDESFCDSIYSSAAENIRIKYKATCIYESDFIEYKSPLDPTVIFYLSNNFENDFISVILTRPEQSCIDPFLSTEAEGKSGSHQFSEVLFTEFMRLQKYGVILNNKDSLETFLNTEIKTMMTSETCPDIDNVYYSEEEGIHNIIGPGCCSLVDTTTTSFSKAFLQPDIQAFKISENYLFIQGSKSGSAYSLFDLNGKLLLEGTILHSIIKVPTFPAILKIQNRTLLVK